MGCKNVQHPHVLSAKTTFCYQASHTRCTGLDEKNEFFLEDTVQFKGAYYLLFAPLSLETNSLGPE